MCGTESIFNKSSWYFAKKLSEQTNTTLNNNNAEHKILSGKCTSTQTLHWERKSSFDIGCHRGREPGGEGGNSFELKRARSSEMESSKVSLGSWDQENSNNVLLHHPVQINCTRRSRTDFYTCILYISAMFAIISARDNYMTSYYISIIVCFLSHKCLRTCTSHHTNWNK